MKSVPLKSEDKASYSLSTLLDQLKMFFSEIKFKHSVFAFPFAMSAFLFVSLDLPSSTELAFLVVCMISARTWAMGVNRIVDRKIDAGNKRTSARKLANGELSPNWAWLFVAVAAVVFVVSSFFLSSTAFYCSVPLLIILAGYTFLKRFTALCHLYLGICLGLAPIAVSVALGGGFSLPLLCLGAAIALWTAGFDILYSLQDFDFDRSKKLSSIPSWFGFRPSIWISRILFGISLVLLLQAGLASQKGLIYYTGLLVIAALMVNQHRLVGWNASRVSELRNIGKAFFDSNAAISIVFFLFALFDVLLLSGAV